jgi:ABC-type protease/lipase transport system fused ATPase/permease subunit
VSQERGPWYSRVLNERGLATLLALVLVGAILWFMVALVQDVRSFQAQMLVEAARLNDQMQQVQISLLEIRMQMDRIERLLVNELGGP